MVNMAAPMARYWHQLPRSRSGPKPYQVIRATANTPAFTTATAWSRAVTGVGATEARSSHLWPGNTAALTPKPKNPRI